MKYKTESIFTKYNIPPTKSINELRVLFQTDPTMRKDLPAVIKIISNPTALLEEELFTPHDTDGVLLPVHNSLLTNVESAMMEVTEVNIKNALTEINEICKRRDSWSEFNYYSVNGKTKSEEIIQSFLSMMMDEMERQFFYTIGEISWTKSKKFIQYLNESIPFITWDKDRQTNFEDKLIEYASKLSSLEGKSEGLEERLSTVLSIAEFLMSSDMIDMLKFTLKKIGDDYDNNGKALLKSYSKIASLYNAQELLDMSGFINRMMNKYLDFHATTNFSGTEIIEVAKLLSKAYSELHKKIKASKTVVNYDKNFDKEDIELGKMLSDFVSSTSESWINTYKTKLNNVKSDASAENLYSLINHIMSANPSTKKLKNIFGNIIIKVTNFDREFAWIVECHKEVNDNPDNAKAADPKDIDDIIAKYYWLIYMSDDIKVELFNNIREISFDILARYNRMTSSIGPYTPNYVRQQIKEGIVRSLNYVPKDFWFGDQRVETAIKKIGGYCTSSVSKSSEYIDKYDMLFKGTKDSKHGRYNYEHPYSSYGNSPSSSSSSSGCYIATCVYGSYDCPEVWLLRRYRDYYLDESWFGRLIIKIYYKISPKLVKWFGRTKWFKKMWKPFLERKIRKLRDKGYKETEYDDKH